MCLGIGIILRRPTRLVYPQLWLNIGPVVAAPRDPKSSKHKQGGKCLFQNSVGLNICVSVCSIFAPPCCNHHSPTSKFTPTAGQLRRKQGGKSDKEFGTC